MSSSDNPIENRPGQSTLSYRVTTQSDSFERMRALARTYAIPSGVNAGSMPLAALTTEHSDDPTLGLFSAWGAVLDVLSFYQERIANEGFLRTATERRSALELSRSVGYELRPGLSASVFLGFELDGSETMPERVEIPAGTRVQSIPAQGEQPQTFEVSAATETRAEWNALRPRLTDFQILGGRPPGAPERMRTLPGPLGSSIRIPLPPQQPEPSGIATTTVYVEGNATRLRKGDPLQVGSVMTQVVSATYDASSDVTAVALKSAVYLRPPIARKPIPTSIRGKQPLSADSVRQYILAWRWEEEQLATFMREQGWAASELLRQVDALIASDESNEDALLSWKQRLTCFGSQAPPWSRLAKLKSDYYNGTDLYSSASSSWDDAKGNNSREIWQDSWGLSYKSGSPAVDIVLDREVSEVSEGSYVLIVGRSGQALCKVTGTQTTAFNGYGTTLRATGLSLEATSPPPPSPPVILTSTGTKTVTQVVSMQVPTVRTVNYSTVLGTLVKVPTATTTTVNQTVTTTVPTVINTATNSFLNGYDFLTRDTVVYCESEELSLSLTRPRDSTEVVQASVTLDHMVLGLQVGRLLALTGVRADALGITNTEILQIGRVVHEAGFTTIEFKEPASCAYVKSSVVLNANIVAATHGETIKDEVLGSGDSSQRNQTFTLSRSPLTYLASRRGGDSTLQIRVNGVRWREVPSLLEQDGHSTCYKLSLDDEGRTVVTFGDGQYGARLPSGENNIVATYRCGCGTAGLVAAGALRLLLDTPLGVKTVLNPLAASGGARSQQLDEVKELAPESTLTAGRAVSLADYAQLAMDSPGVAKVLVQPAWIGGVETLHLTVAADGGQALGSGSPIRQTLNETLRALGSPTQQVFISDYRRKEFQVEAQIVIDPAYGDTTVVEAVRAALAEAFSFDRRKLMQPVRSSEVIHVMQQVPGVRAALLKSLYVGDSAGYSALLLAEPARPDLAPPLGAELLVIALADDDLTVTTEAALEDINL